MADVVSIGIAYDTSQLTAGSRQVQSAMQQLTQVERQTQSASEQLASTSTKTAQAIGQEGRAASSAATGMQQLGTSAQAAGRQVSTLGSAMQSFGQQVGAFGLAQLGVQGLQQALGTLLNAFQEVIRSGIAIAQLRQSFTAIAGGAAAGGREFAFVVKTANQLGLELETVAGHYRSLTAATRGTTLEGAATRDLFLALTNAARAYGLSNEALGRAIMAVQQIASKGKVTMEELRGQLGEALPGAVQILARGLGVTTAALEDLIGKGLDATVALPKLTNQLNIEVPKAAASAGSGIKQLGNEIFLLKGRIAESGLLQWLDESEKKVAKLFRTWREGEEKLQATAAKRLTREMGSGVTPDQLTEPERKQALAATRAVADAERELVAIQKTREERKMGILTSLVASEADERALRLDQAKQEQDALKAKLALIVLERQEQTKRQATYTGPFKEEQANAEAAVAKAKELGNVYKQNKADQEALNKSAALSPEILGKATGTLKEQNVLLSEKIKLNEKALEEATKLIVARPAAMGPPPAELLAQHEALRNEVRKDTAELEKNKKTIEDLEKARTKALQDAETARKKQEHDDEEAARKEVARLRELGAEDDRHIEQLRTLAGRYTEVKAARDEDIASTLKAQLETSQYANEAERLVAAIEDVIRVEKQLPALRADAARSAGTLTDLERLQKQLEPRQRGQSLQQQLAARRKEIETLPGLDTEGRRFALEQADEKIKKALDTEIWQKWSDFAEESLSKVGDAITQFAFHGKLTFKEMVSSIAEDFFRMSLKMLSESALSSAGGAGGGGSGGWLNLALNAGLKLIGVAGGLTGGGQFGMSAATTAGVQADLNTSLLGNPALFQHGGPVTAGKSYIVGEAGPELFVPRQPGVIVPNDQMAGGTTIIVNVSGVQDAQSFVASRGAVQRAIAGGVSQAYRGL
jgi:tape measure domain-containing protein